MVRMVEGKGGRKFGVFILSHERADRVLSWGLLRKSGYRGEIKIVVDNLDSQIADYKARFGAGNVIVFDKARAKEVMDMDLGDNLPHFDRALIIARNYAFEIAKELGWTHFAVWDDDYVKLDWLYGEKPGLMLKKQKPVLDLDCVFGVVCDFLDNTPAVTLAFIQGGDFIGGIRGKFWGERLSIAPRGAVRKAMNFFVFRSDRPVRFYGRLNEDVCAYVVNGMRGELYFSVNYIIGSQVRTQRGVGGLTEVYRNMGTYAKSFYAVMMAPAGVKISMLLTPNRRIHHLVEWEYTVPKILREEVRNGGK